jgi:hypothetical protein
MRPPASMVVRMPLAYDPVYHGHWTHREHRRSHSAAAGKLLSRSRLVMLVGTLRTWWSMTLFPMESVSELSGLWMRTCWKAATDAPTLAYQRE